VLEALLSREKLDVALVELHEITRLHDLRKSIGFTPKVNPNRKAGKKT